MSVVLGSQAAEDKIAEMRRTIDGDIKQGYSNLNRQATFLQDPRVWAGRLADDFRNSQWPEIKKQLDQQEQQLADINVRLVQIAQRIREAGGGYGS
jgi:uncharacterized protein YukE